MKFSISIEIKREKKSKEISELAQKKKNEKMLKKKEKMERVDAYKMRNTLKCVLLRTLCVICLFFLTAFTGFIVTIFCGKFIWRKFTDLIIQQKCQIPLEAKEKIPSFIVDSKAYDLNEFLYKTFIEYEKRNEKV